MSANDADGMENSVDPDQTAPLGNFAPSLKLTDAHRFHCNKSVKSKKSDHPGRFYCQSRFEPMTSHTQRALYKCTTMTSYIYNLSTCTSLI